MKIKDLFNRKKKIYDGKQERVKDWPNEKKDKFGEWKRQDALTLGPGESFTPFTMHDPFVLCVAQTNDAFIEIIKTAGIDNITLEYGKVIEYLIERDAKACGFRLTPVQENELRKINKKSDGKKS